LNIIEVANPIFLILSQALFNGDTLSEALYGVSKDLHQTFVMKKKAGTLLPLQNKLDLYLFSECVNSPEIKYLSMVSADALLSVASLRGKDSNLHKLYYKDEDDASNGQQMIVLEGGQEEDRVRRPILKDVMNETVQVPEKNKWVDTFVPSDYTDEYGYLNTTMSIEAAPVGDWDGAGGKLVNIAVPRLLVRGSDIDSDLLDLRHHAFNFGTHWKEALKVKVLIPGGE
jgi:hypothetical protein